MNTQFGSPFQQTTMFPPTHEEEEKRRRMIEAQRIHAASSQKTHMVTAPVNLGQTQSNPWGEGGTCLGLKILCGAMGLIVVVLVIVLIIKLVHHKGQAQTSASSSGDSQLPMSLQGGFDFGGESLMSTS